MRLHFDRADGRYLDHPDSSCHRCSHVRAVGHPREGSCFEAGSKEKAPQALQDLVDAGYLRKIPKDPFTGSSDTWQVENSDTLISLDQTEPGISDVHSGSNLVGSDGTAYSSW